MTSDVIRRMIEEGAQRQREAEDKARAIAESHRLRDEFGASDMSAIARMSDIDLVAWQAGYPKDSPQFIFGEQLWKYRLARKSAKFAALVAVLSALFGAIVGYGLRCGQEVAKERPNDEPKKNVAPPVAKKPEGRPKVLHGPG